MLYMLMTSPLFGAAVEKSVGQLVREHPVKTPYSIHFMCELPLDKIRKFA